MSLENYVAVAQQYGGYDDLIEQDGNRIEAREVFGDYQGENAWIVSSGAHWGWYTDSYGSCSYCDAFESACDEGLESVEKLGKQMREGIHWFDSKDALVEYLLSKDHELEAYDYYGIGKWLKNWASEQKGVTTHG